MIKVLFVDDDSIFLKMIALYFKKEKFDFALGVKEARAKLLQKGPFDLIITDFQMPEENGLSFAKFIHKQYPKTRIILISSLNVKETIPDYVKFISKPISMDDIAKHINKCAVEKT